MSSHSPNYENEKRALGGSPAVSTNVDYAFTFICKASRQFNTCLAKAHGLLRPLVKEKQPSFNIAYLETSGVAALRSNFCLDSISYLPNILGPLTTLVCLFFL